MECFVVYSGQDFTKRNTGTELKIACYFRNSERVMLYHGIHTHTVMIAQCVCTHVYIHHDTALPIQKKGEKKKRDG